MPGRVAAMMLHETRMAVDVQRNLLGACCVLAKGKANPRRHRPAPRVPSPNRDIRLFIGAGALTAAHLALNESGLHGQWLLDTLLGIFAALAFISIFFNQLAVAAPRLPIVLRQYIGAPAFFLLFFGAATAGWWLDYGARITATATPGGVYQAPQLTGAPDNLPFIPTHARLQFPIGSDQAAPVGVQDNIWRWNTVGVHTNGPAAASLEVWIVVLTFDKPTKAEKITVHTIEGPGRALPRYNVIGLDSRTATILFNGDLTGFTLDITNEP